MKNVELNYERMPHGTDCTNLIFLDSAQEIFNAFWQEFNGDNNGESEELVIVTDTKIATLECVKPFLLSAKEKKIETVIIESGEENKTFENVLKILRKTLSHSFSRRCTFLALGGGVISDMTALASSLYKRGARLQIIPTTLLSMADASIGGKTGCDFDNFKNMLGTFYPASKIYFSVDFIKTLSKKEFLSGMGEVVKTALLYDSELFDILKNESKKILDRDEKMLSEIVYRCACAKAKIVEQDITEKNIRRQLNLGHTFGHALESVAGFGVVPHGMAVGWGISRAIQLSQNLGLCSKEYKDEVFSLLALYGYETENLPKSIKKCENAQEKLIQAMKQDKKNEQSTIYFILQNSLCKTIITSVDLSAIKAVL